MAKKASILVQLVPEENPETGTKYLIKIQTRNNDKKVRLRKYDPVLRKHVWFVQKRLPNPKAR
jgi:large subunit ribosomal protein L33